MAVEEAVQHNALAEGGCREPSGWLRMIVAVLYEQLEGQPRLVNAKSARHVSCAAHDSAQGSLIYAHIPIEHMACYMASVGQTLEADKTTR